ncbi:MAG TPA: hypothetical protein VK654_14575 [Nitrospirota bacterium]|nr:hypothetical protein [Nitrospirota bacterium]
MNYTLLCDDVREEVGGKFSLMGLFETIFAPAFPAIHNRFAIVNEWAGGRGDFTVRIRLLAPDRTTVLSESESRLALFNETQRHRDISLRFNTAFNIPGTYWVEILLDGEQAAIIPLRVQKVTEQIVH